MTDFWLFFKLKIYISNYDNNFKTKNILDLAYESYLHMM